MAQVMGISVSSARRYIAGTRMTPDAVAARLHFLAFVVADLAGAYNDVGIQRWFHRPRKPLDGHTPAQLLAGDWGPDDEGPRRVRKLVATFERYEEAELEESHNAGYCKNPPMQREFDTPEEDLAWGHDAWRDE